MPAMATSDGNLSAPPLQITSRWRGLRARVREATPRRESRTCSGNGGAPPGEVRPHWATCERLGFDLERFLVRFLQQNDVRLQHGWQARRHRETGWREGGDGTACP